MKAKTFLLGFIIGGVAAGVSTLLNAPSSGRETRENLKDNKDVLLNHLGDIKDSLIELKNTALTASKEGKEVIVSLINDINIAISEWKSQIQPHQEELKNELQSIESSVRELESHLHANKEI
jgi:gas vesicle protein